MRAVLSGSAPSELARSSEPVLGRLDEWRFIDTLARNVDLDLSLRIPSGSKLYVRGWTLLSEPARAPRGVLVIVSDDVWFPAVYGKPRPDIVKAFPDFGILNCGFAGVGKLTGLPLGPHEFTLAVLDENDAWRELARQRFDLVPSGEFLAGMTPIDDGRMRFMIDDLLTLRDPYELEGGRLRAKLGDVIYLRGWAADMELRAALGGVFGIFDGNDYVVGVHGLPRIDVSTAFDLSAAYKSGFTLRMPTNRMTPGTHTLDVALVTADGRSYFTHRVAELELVTG
jgi:hypothetical protein